MFVGVNIYIWSERRSGGLTILSCKYSCINPCGCCVTYACVSCIRLRHGSAEKLKPLCAAHSKIPLVQFMCGTLTCHYLPIRIQRKSVIFCAVVFVMYARYFGYMCATLLLLGDKMDQFRVRA